MGIKRLLHPDNFKKAMRYCKRNGFRSAFYAAKERLGEAKEPPYVYEAPSPEALDMQRSDSRRFQTTFSILVPVFHTDETHLRDMITSVMNQTYDRWELILADAGHEERVAKIAEQLAKANTDVIFAIEKETTVAGNGTQAAGEIHRLIRYLPLSENKGISENTNRALAVARGEYVGFLDHDDLLTPDALYEMAAAIEDAREMPAFLYSDEDKLYGDSFQEPNRKPDFDADLLLSNNYICHFLVMRRDLAQRLRLRSAYDGSQDYDLVLRAVSVLRKESKPLSACIRHVPNVLYHWRIHAGSTAGNTDSKAYAYTAGQAAIEDFIHQEGWQAIVMPLPHLGFYRLSYTADIFAQRPEVGAVGGRFLDRKKRICGGAYDAEGNCLYEGLPAQYSGGGTHRAVLAQEVAAVDIRLMRIRPELADVFYKITGVIYQEDNTITDVMNEATGRQADGQADRQPDSQPAADVSDLHWSEEEYRKRSVELGAAIAERGYIIVWQPDWEKRMP